MNDTAFNKWFSNETFSGDLEPLFSSLIILVVILCYNQLIKKNLQWRKQCYISEKLQEILSHQIVKKTLTVKLSSIFGLS